jgi:hypothetical protein
MGGRLSSRSLRGASPATIGATLSVEHRMASSTEHNYQPPGGYVPDEKTAVRIAVAVWEPIYGVDTIAGQRPSQARLENGVWIVEGSLPRVVPGGVAIAEIVKDDGRISRVSHGR